MDYNSKYYTEEFKTSVKDLVASIEKAMAMCAEIAEKKDGIHRCYKCGQDMCEVSQPFGKDHYYQCFTPSCKGRKEWIE